MMRDMSMRRRNFLALASAGACVPALAESRNLVKITGLETDLLRFPPGKPYFDAIHEFGPERGGVVVRLLTNAGITGWGYSSFGMIGGGPKVVQTVLETEVRQVLVGKDPAFPKKLRAELWQAVEYHGVQGIASFALAAADIALWDILGKIVGWPVGKMLGAFRDRVPAYAMCGWYYDHDDDLSQYRRAIESHLEEGFGAVKIKVGRHDLDDDARRIRVAQELLGKNRPVMVDANQVFNRNEALRRGRVYQQMGCFWYEEPLAPHEKDGYAELARDLDIRIATGENEYTKFAFLDLLTRRAADVIQPDNRRAGGVTEWMEIAALADAFGVEVASHGGGPTNVHMLCAMPNAIYIESGSLKGDSSSVEKLRMVKGEILAPETPGMGSELRRDYVQKYKVG
jgi:L-alanine-DL-glutamate epimerase-like enolase superfamily enzyme